MIVTILILVVLHFLIGAIFVGVISYYEDELDYDTTTPLKIFTIIMWEIVTIPVLCYRIPTVIGERMRKKADRREKTVKINQE